MTFPVEERPALTDPVCGMTVKEDAPNSSMHDGRLYRFCSAKCKGKFDAAPADYLGAAHPAAEHAGHAGHHGHHGAHSAAAETPAAPGATYTCPMHPEIRQDHPGNCPICGMALEPVMPELE
jgi:P-type Cu+ transporter